MASEEQWHTLAKHYYEQYVDALNLAGIEVQEKFDDLPSEEIDAITDGLKFAVQHAPLILKD